jgi:hypothetical protein
MPAAGPATTDRIDAGRGRADASTSAAPPVPPAGECDVAARGEVLAQTREHAQQQAEVLPEGSLTRLFAGAGHLLRLVDRLALRGRPIGEEPR